MHTCRNIVLARFPLTPRKIALFDTRASWTQRRNRRDPSQNTNPFIVVEEFFEGFWRSMWRILQIVCANIWCLSLPITQTHPAEVIFTLRTLQVMKFSIFLDTNETLRTNLVVMKLIFNWNLPYWTQRCTWQLRCNFHICSANLESLHSQWVRGSCFHIEN